MINEIVVTSPTKDYTEQEVRDGFAEFLKNVEQGKLVEVVLCKDCKKFRSAMCRASHEQGTHDYCSHGERKEEAK
jgi:ribosomal protein L7Ae-like RNA K-turn-binding protein